MDKPTKSTEQNQNKFVKLSILYYIPSKIINISPPLLTVAIMPSFTVLLLFEIRFSLAAFMVSVSGGREFRAAYRVIVLAAELLATLPAPTLSTSCTHYELIIRFKPTSKNIIARGVFQTPTLTPGALFGVVAHRSI